MKKRIVILGAAESGVGAALLAKHAGYDVFVSDAGKVGEAYKKDLGDAGIQFEEGGHTEDEILRADIIIKSPGIPEKNALIQKLRSIQMEIISEIEFAYQCMGKSKLIAITGSNGKTTTASLIYHICKTAHLDCAVVGNIGYSFARQIAVSPKEVYVAEISSFQLDDVKSFRPHVAVLTNITADHLDRYNNNVEEYIKSKSST